MEKEAAVNYISSYFKLNNTGDVRELAILKVNYGAEVAGIKMRETEK